jgi:hypothetical protein
MVTAGPDRGALDARLRAGCRVCSSRTPAARAELPPAQDFPGGEIPTEHTGRLIADLRVNGRSEILPTYRVVTPEVCARPKKWAEPDIAQTIRCSVGTL